jgi:putative transposase
MTDYPTNVTNNQWQVIEKFLDTSRKRKYELREIINAILYLVKTGCQWRMLPKDFPAWQLVYYYFCKWNKDGTIEQIHESLVEKIRVKARKNEEPTVGIIDAQSVRTTCVSSVSSGFDAGKKIKGRKRHIVVDTLGLILCVVVHSADIQDRDGAKMVLTILKDRWKRIIKIIGDGGYRGALIEYAKHIFGYTIEIITRDELHQFKVLPKRWIVERTFAWLDTNRRNSKDYERLTENSLAMIQLASIRINLKRF